MTPRRNADTLFTWLKQTFPAFKPVTSVDLGSGTGVLTFSATQSFTSLKEVIMIDKDSSFLHRSMQIAADFFRGPLLVITKVTDLLQPTCLPNGCDLVLQNPDWTDHDEN